MKISPFRASSQNMRTHDENINSETRFCDNHRNVKVREERSRKMQKEIDGISLRRRPWYNANMRRSRTLIHLSTRISSSILYRKSTREAHDILVSEKKFYECLLERSRGMRARLKRARREKTRRRKKDQDETFVLWQIREMSARLTCSASRIRFHGAVGTTLSRSSTFHLPGQSVRLPRSSRRDPNIANSSLFYRIICGFAPKYDQSISI